MTDPITRKVFLRRAAASGSICSRQPYQNSGKPCSRTISGPSPAST